ncbi:MAG: ATPase [Bacillus thermozeamaize]|uniref:ATPase n=1 Tax=Bacillus thermozeamaize TaxID=230954 RepID=A0A1Y3PAE0_9BACI|nr:MAG: ATPase [Bacillus thermozeamaize]
MNPSEIQSTRDLIRQNMEISAVAASGLLIIAGWLMGHFGWQKASVVSFLLAFAIGGYFKAKEGLEELIFERQLTVNLLMILAAVGSAIIGYWAEGAMLIFIFALSGALETYAMNRSNQEVSKLMALQPMEARLYEDGAEKTVPVQELRVGQVILVKPGDLVAADGTIIEGSTTIDQSAITGESVPVEKNPGDEVLAGTINGNGGILVRVDKPHNQTLFRRMIELVQRAQTEKPPQQTFVERFEKTYVKVVLFAVLLVAAIPPLFLGWTWEQAFYRAMVFLVVASPCALVASIMPAILSAISNGARRGVLFKGGTQLQALEQIKVIALDKTGTLTKGVPEVKDVVSLVDDLSEEELLQMTASVEQFSTHPLAEAVVRKARESGLRLFRPDEMSSETGFGVQAFVNGSLWKVGKREYMEVPFSDGAIETAERLEKQGKTVMFVQQNERLVGLFAVQDVIRQEAVEAIQTLKRQGIHTVMLTGDSLATAQALANEVGLDEYYANCLPDQKVAYIQQLRKKHGKIAMVGDGVNDAPALASATVGIAMGAGTDVALETADIVLMKDELSCLPYMVRLAQKTNRIIRQNIVFSIAVICLLILSNFFQIITLPLGVIGHEGSTLLVILNGLRMLGYRE